MLLGLLAENAANNAMNKKTGLTAGLSSG